MLSGSTTKARLGSRGSWQYFPRYWKQVYPNAPQDTGVILSINLHPTPNMDLWMEKREVTDQRDIYLLGIHIGMMGPK